MLFYILLNYVRSIEQLRAAFLLLAIVGALQGLLVIAEAQFGFSPFGGWQAELNADLDDGEVRVVGTSSHPIILAGFFHVVLACAGLLLATTQDRRLKLVYAIFMVIYLVGWWFTFARSSWIGLSGMLFVGMLLASKPTRILAIVGGSIVFLL